MKKILLTDRCSIRTVIDEIVQVPSLGFDTESSGPELVGQKMLNVYRSALTGFSVALPSGAYYVPVSHRKKNAPYQEALHLLQAIADTNAIVWAHNWKHDLKAVHREIRGWAGPKRIADSMVAAPF